MATDYKCSHYLRGQIPRTTLSPLKCRINSTLTIFIIAFLFGLLVRIDFCSGETCKSGTFACKDGLQCILNDWECDGDPDCDDGSDEDPNDCGNKTCSDDHFRCGEGLPCIPSSWKCDANEDCVNGMDEVNCTQTCKEDEFQCADTLRCITNRWQCDLDKDCTDGSDEIGCAKVTCRNDQFRCNNSRCIPPTWRCDGDNDCADMSDEENCTTHHGDVAAKICPEYDYQCNISLECINRAWLCDGDKDCQDETDEENCDEKPTCSPDQFQCHNGSCIDKTKRCDRNNDCTDLSDEFECNYEPLVKSCDPVTEFDCSAGNGALCIPLSKACDNKTDCESGADEDSKYCSRFTPEHVPDNLCMMNTLNCSHNCYNVSGVPRCRCKPGYQLQADNRTCEDIDECIVNIAICSQICTNTVGTYRCQCHVGYHKDPVNQKCKATGEEPRLLFANRHDLREFRLHTSHYQSLVDQLHSAIALDYDFREKYIYWSDVASESITRRHMEAKPGTEHTPLVTSHINTPDGLALDWIHKNLYWTDTGNNRIEVISVGDLNNTWRRVLVSDGLDEPRAIVVDPRDDERYLYWTDWGDTPKIEKSNLDGSERKIILGSESNQSPGLVWPNGLAIDYESNRLFWVDAKLHLIGSSDLNGNQRQIVFTSFRYLKHPFAVTVFEDDIYWSDWEAESILKVSKHSSNKNNHTVMPVANQLYSPMDVHVYHELKQPLAKDVCTNAPCQHLCFPMRTPPLFYRCDCSHYDGGKYELHSDGKSCIDITPSESSSTPTPPQQPTKSTSSSKAVSSTKSSDNDVTHSPGGANIDGQSGGDVREGGANVLSVIIGLSIVLVLTAIIVAVVYYRFYRVRTPKGLNFDNPVYRRTTEDDQFCIERSTYLQPKALSSLLQPLNSERV